MSEPTAQYPTLKNPLLRSYQHTLHDLSNAFAVNFDLWEYSDEWVCASHHYSADEAFRDFLEKVDLAALLNQIVKDDSPKVQPLTSSSHLILLPLTSPKSASSKQNAVVAAGIVTNGDFDIYRRLALTTFHLIREKQQTRLNNQQINQYAEQVCNDFEELYWLRNLAQHLEYCGADNSLAEVAEKVLPSLTELIKADSLLFFPIHTELDAAVMQEEAPALIYGNQEQEIDLSECRALIAQFKEQARIQPVVHNHEFHNPHIDQPDLKSAFALVPVAKGNFIAGWMLAFNKEKDAQGIYDYSHAYSMSSSERDFGTFEVGLMAASGILLANHARNAHLFAEQESFTIGVIRSLINSIDAKDPYTCGHSDRVALMAKRVAQQMGRDAEQCEQIYMSGLLHDVGKIGIPDNVLCKKERLTDEEFDVIKQHPEIGYSILKHLKPLSYVLPGVLHHHECFDGTGYPHQLAGEDIPLEGRILAVVDAYDAMTSSRPYRSAMPFEKAESILMEHVGTQWDTKIVKHFFAALDDIHNICSRTVSNTKELFQHGDSSDDVEHSSEKDYIDTAVSLTHLE